MSHDFLLLVTTAVAIVGIVLLITWAKIPPVFALLLGTLFLGVTTDVGFAGTPEAVTSGFADVLGDIGVLITFGVITGALLTVTDTMQRLVEAMLRIFGERSLPYIIAVALSSLFTSIYSDVLLVLSAPLARRLGSGLGPRGIALMGGALTAGIEVGLVFVAPGVAAVAVAGVLGVPLGQMFLCGLLVGVPTAVLTTLVFRLALPRLIRWDPAQDEVETAAAADSGDRSETGSGQPVAAAVASPAVTKQLPLTLAISPVLLSLVLIAGGALASGLGVDHDVIGFVTDPVVAISFGAFLAFVLAGRVRSRQEIGAAVGGALTSCGPILILSGISGSLGAVIEKSGLADVLGSAFSSGFLPPLLLVWLVAAVLHIALGSISVSAITAAGILAPIAGSLGVPVVLVALAAGSGALFLPHVSSNFFWMFQSLLGLSTRGTFKTHTVAMSLASLISLPIVLVLGVVA
ncbi:gluconate permease [Saccharopolyspora sp. TS4A08]|uniref:Gluconate permease n=1 Tax=Saccharopolyspora ipomoeae TaxID=3042027 RepID=A0ABT6PJL1_9PSEU|nr:SLC13 family permease [Saccharopolyspora sp. TS4A08]MDI2028168.1 gluconate permease [Saccharopolyspora sp. TS4A08]